MDEFTNPTNLNATLNSWATPITKAFKIISISSRMDIEVARHVRCPNCRSEVIVRSLNSGELLDRNGKRHFCDDAERIKHEENCVIEIQQFIEHYNRHELSSFQVELNIP